MASKFINNNPMVTKVFFIAIIILALMIPLSMLRSLITERTQMRDQAYKTVANGWGGRLTTGGLLLRVPFDATVRAANGEVSLVRHQLYVLANDLKIEVQLKPEAEPRHVGIYQVPVYLAKLKLTGNFNSSTLLAAAKREGNFHWHRAHLILPLSEVRSVRELGQARFADRSVQFGPAEPGAYSGIEADIDLTDTIAGKATPFNIEVTLAGSQAISLLPLAAVTQVEMNSTWPHPQFLGAFLPATHSISDDGFRAQWQVLELNRGFSQSWVDNQVDNAQLLAASFGVSLFQSVDVYQRNERAVKYALMFIALTFLSVYAWELLSTVAVHPMQYLLVGLALSTFYLLLIALSEHLAFWIAYLMGAIGLIALLGIYTAGAMRSRGRGFLMASVMSLVYGLLYLLVLSENYALLMGAIVLFGALATVMLATRHVQWYGPLDK